VYEILLEHQAWESLSRASSIQSDQCDTLLLNQHSQSSSANPQHNAFGRWCRSPAACGRTSLVPIIGFGERARNHPASLTCTRIFHRRSIRGPVSRPRRRGRTRAGIAAGGISRRLITEYTLAGRRSFRFIDSGAPLRLWLAGANEEFLISR
jgi:hypothetical protein